MKPGTNGRKRETREEFATRVGKELREEAKRVKSGAEADIKREVKRIREDAEKKARAIRVAASKMDGKRS